MDNVHLENFRCFRERQDVRLAPLTLLVGENSTGKTSFLALLRALWDVAFQEIVPDFRQEPYDLGVFPDIAHKRGGRGGQADSFEAGFEYAARSRGKASKASFQATFRERRGSPFPVTRSLSQAGTWLEASVQDDGKCILNFSAQNGGVHTHESTRLSRDDTRLIPFFNLVMEVSRESVRGGGETATENEIAAAETFARSFRLSGLRVPKERPFANAPVRSRPRRTYDPIRPIRDPEGEYIPTYLASEFHRNRESWTSLKAELEEFGQASGLFDEMTVKPLGKTEGTPFQLQVRRFAKRARGPERNLIDVGYGVSQALPVLTELLREEAPAMFLLQQPEVHLHPKAQAALGSLFCDLAATGRQIVVETHSDYIIDRVRMDLRDQKSPLKPDDVSILYFEPGDLAVNIHSIRLDKMGNVVDAPDGYGQFFMEELRRSVGI